MKRLFCLFAVLLMLLTACGHTEPAVEEGSLPVSAAEEVTEEPSSEEIPDEMSEVSDISPELSSQEAEVSEPSSQEEPLPTEKDLLFQNAADHCTFKFGEEFSFKSAEYTMDDELRTAIYDAVPELSDYPEEYQDELLKQVARDAHYGTTMYGTYGSEAEVKVSFEKQFEEYEKYGYAEKYEEKKEPAPGTMDRETVESLLDNFSAANYVSDEEARAAFGELVRMLEDIPLPDVENPEDYCSEPEVTAYCDEFGMHKFIHIGEFEQGVAVYHPADENGDLIIRDDGILRRYHITKDGEMFQLSDDMSRVELSDGNGAKFTDHIRW